MSARWHLVTGEYPPGGGGVGDYTRLLAHALAEQGEAVQVWAPAGESEQGVPVIPTGFHGSPLRLMDRVLGPGDPSRVLLVQYAPQAFGRRGANLSFCRWVLRRAELGDQVRVMFHEPWVPFAARPDRVVLSLATRWMARLLLRAAARSYVSVPAWEELLRPWAPRRWQGARWLPIPSTIPVTGPPMPGGPPVLGHFGTYGAAVASLLEPALVEALGAVPGASALLVGRGSAAFADDLVRRRPSLRGRVAAEPAAAPVDVSGAIRRMTVALQPYPDGATSRRTTLMAALAHGVPVATHLGRWSEPVWTDAGMPIASSAAGVGSLASRMLREAPLRREVADAGSRLYRERFAMEHTVRALLEEGG